MKAIIATAAGVLGLGGLLVANAGRTTSVQAAPQSASALSVADRVNTNGPTLVNCGEGRQALVWPSSRGTGVSQVECVGPETTALPVDPYATAVVPNAYGAQFSNQTLIPGAPVRTVVQERVVYRDRPVARTSSRTSTRRASSVYRTASDGRVVRNGRSWKKSAVIIGGSTAGGAGVGAILGGKSGAKKGAVVGLVGGTVYDIATRNKDNH